MKYSNFLLVLSSLFSSSPFYIHSFPSADGPNSVPYPALDDSSYYFSDTFQNPKYFSADSPRQLYHNSSTICSPRFEDMAHFTCFQADDCLQWEQLHTNRPASSFNQLYGYFSKPYLWQCSDRRCSKLQNKGRPGSPCWSGQYEMTGYSGCQPGLTCSSNVCQIPLAAGCGDCTADITSCMPGTVCDSLSNKCSASLREGSRCVYKTIGLVGFMDENGVDIDYEQGWTDTILNCNPIHSLPIVPDTLYCDVENTQTCIPIPEDPLALEYGAECRAPEDQGHCPGFCDENLKVCRALGNIGESCTPGGCMEGLICSSYQRCIEPYTLAENVPCGGSGECQLGLGCFNNGTCQPLKERGGSCSQDGECSGLDVCINNLCSHFGSGQENDSCDGGVSKFIALSSCAPGLDCSFGVCTAISNRSCSFNSDCSNDPSPSILCNCLTTEDYLHNTTLGKAVCSESAGRVPSQQLYNQISTCSASLGIDLNNNGLSYLEWGAPNQYRQFLCCLLCSLTDNEWEDPLFSNAFYYELFGRDDAKLACDNDYGDLSPKPHNFCSSSADFSRAGSQSLAGCPNTKTYSGIAPKPRSVILYQEDMDVECGIYICNGNGKCDVTRQYCRCYDDYWGEYCQFDESSRDDERQFLKEFYNATTGHNWLKNDGWMYILESELMDTQFEYCVWFGIKCTEDGFLLEIDLPENNLQGVIPDSIALATDLNVLNLADNFMTGELPNTLYGLKQLRILDLSNNGFFGVLTDDIYHLTNLEALELGSNSFSGSVPWGLGYLENANIIHIQDNFFNGTLPAVIVNLLNVTDWDLTSNEFDRGTYLPYPLCSFCQRTWTECDFECEGSIPDDCVQGYLLACTSPRAYQVKRTTVDLPDLDFKPRISRMFMSSIPEGCVHRVG